MNTEPPAHKTDRDSAPLNKGELRTSGRLLVAAARHGRGVGGHRDSHPSLRLHHRCRDRRALRRLLSCRRGHRSNGECGDVVAGLGLLHWFLAALFIVVGVVAFFRPEDTFVGLAAVMSFYFVFRGAFEYRDVAGRKRSAGMVGAAARRYRRDRYRVLGRRPLEGVRRGAGLVGFSWCADSRHRPDCIRIHGPEGRPRRGCTRWTARGCMK